MTAFALIISLVLVVNSYKSLTFLIATISVFNFKDIYKSLTATKAAFLVNNQDELIVKLSELLTDKEFYKDACDDAAKIFRENSGATCYALNVIKM